MSLTPEEKSETFDIFDEIKSERVKELVNAVLKDDYISARALAKQILHDEEILCEVTKQMCHDPSLTKKSVAELVRARVRASFQINTAPTAWERILKD